MTLLQRAEAEAVRACLVLLRALGPVRASNLSGAVARAIGPHLPVSRVARANLRAAFPDWTTVQTERVVRGVWDSIGRTIGELPHVGNLRETAAGPGLELVGIEHVLALSGPAVLVSGHLGNWEVFARAAALLDRPLALFYRAAGNPAVDAMLGALRREAAGGEVVTFAKGSAGARDALRHLRGGGRLAMLVDQKMNDGIAARFFGRTAMTAPAAAALALRFGCPILAVRNERVGPARLRLTAEPPLPHPATGDRHADVAALTQALNDRLEAWIRARPEQWLWLHRRWPR